MLYETVIGLETHAQLQTQSKMFCNCSNRFGDEPNTNICPVCTGQPGTLPVTNKRAIELAIKTALVLNCKIAPRSVFARKNYFYPDLPKDYQISQYELPLATNGYLDINVDGQTKRIGITRVHLEEDAGKLVHKGAERIMGAQASLVDYNRTGSPLMEIVSEPDIRSPKEAAIFMETLASLLRYIEVCDAKLEEGSLRCDANISLRPIGQSALGTKTELKNMNSFKAIEKALLAEVERQGEQLSKGEKIIQETRFFDDTTGNTRGMRSKEDAHDYRYFPEPDLVPIEPETTWIEEIKSAIGELPADKERRFSAAYQLSGYEAHLLVSDKPSAAFFEVCIKLYDKPKIIANWMLGDLQAYLNANHFTLEKTGFTPAQLAELLKLVDAGTISGKIAKTVLVEVLKTGKQVKEVIAQAGLTQISGEEELLKIVREVIAQNTKVVDEYKGGKKTAIAFLVGQVMKLSQGRANPGLANKILTRELL